MTYQYLLDTNIISDLVKNPQGLVFQRIETVGENSVCTSIIVACELQFGAAKSGSLRLARQLDSILGVLPILPLESSATLHYATIRKHLEQKGTPIGSNDLLIAAHALALNLTLVTANIREFSRVPDLSFSQNLART